MSDEAASDWLAAALAETGDLSDLEFGEVCSDARRECSYHGQIVPRMMRDYAARQADVAAYIKNMMSIPSPPGWSRPQERPALASDNMASPLIESAAKALKRGN